MKDLREAQKGTFLSKINEIFESGQWEGEPSEKTKEEEKVIGELTDYEKAIFSRKIQLIEELKKMKEEPVNIFEIQEIISKIEMIEGEISIIDKIFWKSLRQRLSSDFNTIGIRKGWQIIGKEKKESSDELDMVFSFLSKIREKFQAEHDCNNCVDYDSCSSPYKKKRE